MRRGRDSNGIGLKYTYGRKTPILVTAYTDFTRHWYWICKFFYSFSSFATPTGIFARFLSNSSAMTMRKRAFFLLLAVIASEVFCATVPDEKLKISSKYVAIASQPLKNAKQTRPIIPASPRSATSQKRGGQGQLITTRFDSSGIPQQQCRCTVFHLCNRDDVYESPTGEQWVQTSLDSCVRPKGLPLYFFRM